MKNRETEAVRHLQPLDLGQLEERLEVSTLGGGLVGQNVWDGGLIICCRPEKCHDGLIPMVSDDPAPEWDLR